MKTLLHNFQFVRYNYYMVFILTEEISTARRFAAALNCKKGVGHFFNDNYTIIYSVGYLYELCPPEKYAPEYKNWGWQNLPIIPDPFKYIRVGEYKERASFIENFLLKGLNDKKNELIIATQQTNEGELIARIAIKQANIKNLSQIKRFWVSLPLTSRVILFGLKKLLPISRYNKLAAYAYAKEQAEWLYSTNITRLVSLLAGRLCVIGRLQATVLNLISQNNLERKIFIPRRYQTLRCEVEFDEGSIGAKLVDITSEKRTTVFERNNSILESAKQAGEKNPIVLYTHEISNKVEQSEKLFSLTTLQAKAYAFFSYVPEKTAKILHTLFEKYSCISYPITENNTLSIDDVPLVKEILALLAQSYPKKTENINQQNVCEKNELVFSNLNNDEHGAIIPVKPIQAEATESEKKIFTLIVRNFMSIFADPYQYIQHTVTFSIRNYTFQSVFTTIDQLGWKKNYKTDKPDSSGEVFFTQKNIIALKGKITAKNFFIEETQTEPKDYFRLDSLLLFLLNPLQDDQNKQFLGLGQERAAAIKYLLDRKYIELQEKKLIVSSEGNFILKQLQKNSELAQIADISQTMEWEKILYEAPDKYLYATKEHINRIFASLKKK